VARRTYLGVALVALLAFAAAPAARGAEGDAGIFSWRPSLRTSLVANDNTNYSDNDAEGAIGGWIQPRAELSYRMPSLELGADLGVDFRRYTDGSLGDELYRAVAWGEAGLGHGLTLRMANAFVPQAIRVGLPDDEAANLVQSNRSQVGLRWWRPLMGSSELQVGVQGTYLLTDDYTEAVPGAGGVVYDEKFHADYAEGLGFVEVHTPLGEQSSVYVRVQGAYRSFSDVSMASHGNVSLLTGIRTTRWRNLELEVAGGAGALSFDSFADELRALGKARARYQLPEGWSIALEGRHLNTPNLAGEEAMESTGELSLAKHFDSGTEASLKVFVTRFDGDLRSTDANLFGAAELRVRHQLTRFLQVEAAYRHWRNAGGFDLDDFAQNRLVVGLAIRR